MAALISFIILIFLLGAIKTKKSKRKYYRNYEDYTKAKGNEYEFYIAEIFKKAGYKVYMKGYNEGYNDKGIDLICYKGNEIVLVQCKNWKTAVTLEAFKKFVNDCKNYEYNNYEIFKNKNTKRYFIISNKIKNLEVDEYVKYIKNKVELKQIEINNDEYDTTIIKLIVIVSFIILILCVLLSSINKLANTETNNFQNLNNLQSFEEKIEEEKQKSMEKQKNEIEQKRQKEIQIKNEKHKKDYENKLKEIQEKIEIEKQKEQIKQKEEKQKIIIEMK